MQLLLVWPAQQLVLSDAVDVLALLALHSLDTSCACSVPVVLTVDSLCTRHDVINNVDLGCESGT